MPLFSKEYHEDRAAGMSGIEAVERENQRDLRRQQDTFRTTSKKQDDGTLFWIIVAPLFILGILVLLARTWAHGLLPYLWHYELITRKFELLGLSYAALFLLGQASIIWLVCRWHGWKLALLAVLMLPYANIILGLVGWQLSENIVFFNSIHDTIDKMLVPGIGYKPRLDWGGFVEFTHVRWLWLNTQIAYGVIGYVMVIIPLLAYSLIMKAIWRA